MSKSNTPEKEFDFRSVGGVMVIKGDEVTWDFGWRPMPAEVARVQAELTYPVAARTPIGKIAEDDLPGEVFLWQVYERLFGAKLPGKNQGRVGSCVSFGTNKAVEATMLCEIAAGEPEEFHFLVEEVTYGGSRVEVGGGRIRGDGSVGAWAADFVRKWGIIARGKYGNYDLTRYSESTCRQFGDRGVPDDLESEAKLHPVTDVTKVTTWADAKRMMATGHGVAICSDQGFSMKRDSRGVAAPSGSWAHCMNLDGYVVSGEDEFGYISNQWGPDAHTGPVGWGEPNGYGFWAESRVCDRMLRQGDSWAFAGVRGWQKDILPLWLV